MVMVGGNLMADIQPRSIGLGLRLALFDTHLVNWVNFHNE